MIDKTTRELFIYDDIGPDWAGRISATLVREALSDLGPGDVDVRVNSYGGSVDEALAMIEVMDRHNGQIRVSVDSIAASAASLFPARFPSTAAKHARIMIHSPLAAMRGYLNAKELRTVASTLDKYEDSLLEIYMPAMKLSREEVLTLFDAETWFSASEAKDAGLVGEVKTGGAQVQPNAYVQDRYEFKNVPADILQMTATGNTGGGTPLRVAASLAILKRKIESRKIRKT